MKKKQSKRFVRCVAAVAVAITAAGALTGAGDDSAQRVAVEKPVFAARG